MPKSGKPDLGDKPGHDERKIRCLTNFCIGLYSTLSRAMRGVSADMLACGAGPALALAACNRGTGTPQAAVRGVTEAPPPLVAGRGAGLGGRDPRPRSRHRPSMASRRRLVAGIRKHGPRAKNRRTGAPQGARLPQGRQTEDRLRQAALRSLTACGACAIRGREKNVAPDGR